MVEDGWAADSVAAGPFRSEEVLRAFRIARTLVPEGCERGPWRGGIALLPRSKLPSAPDVWATLEEAWLPPSVSLYSDADVGGVVNEVCCQPALGLPVVEWEIEKRNADRGTFVELVSRYEKERNASFLAHPGRLKKEWNVHPLGSLIFVESRGHFGVFCVVDLPKTEHDKVE